MRFTVIKIFLLAKIEKILILCYIRGIITPRGEKDYEAHKQRALSG